MQDLTPVGLSKDHKKLVLISARGEEFAVELDQRLRTVLRGDQARLGQLEMTMESTLRPRDIQTRIRAGETAEAVAAAANTTVDKIMGFAGPVLAERAHIATSAMLASVRRKSADSSSAARTLQDSVTANLLEVGLRADDVQWDAWRRDDGRWTVVAEFDDGSRQQRAEFSYDTRGRFVVAENDAARFLTGESRQAQSRSSEPRQRRLNAVPAGQDELPLGDDAIEMVREADVTAPDDSHEPAAGPAQVEDADEHATQDAETAETAEVDPAAAVEAEPAGAAEQAPEAELVADHADADWMGRGPHTDEATSSQSATKSAAKSAASETAEPAAEADHEPTVEVPPVRKRKGRASVPSWDEIMFGGGGQD